MASTDLSVSPEFAIPNGEAMKIAIVVASWNHHITSNLLKGCVSVLIESQVIESNILVEYVPGSFELPLAAKWMIQKYQPDAVICLGCVIKGETYHFELVSDACANGVMQLSLETNIPVVLGILSDYNEQQSIDRSGGRAHCTSNGAIGKKL